MTHALIDGCLAELRRRLPAGLADEIADGLLQAYEDHLASGTGSGQAARAALAEFGDPTQSHPDHVRSPALR